MSQSARCILPVVALALTVRLVTAQCATSWQPFGTAIGVAGEVAALITTRNGDVIAGGALARAGGVAVANIARWDGVAWSAMGPGVPAYVRCILELANGNIVAGGAGDFGMPNISVWNGASWSGLPGSPPVFAMAELPNGDLVGGGLDYATNPASPFVTRWNGTSWAPLGGGLAATGTGFVDALVTLPDGSLVACGLFDRAGTTPVQSIARWHGNAWHALPGLTSPTGSFLASMKLLPDGRLVVGGAYVIAGSWTSVATWDGTSWTRLAGPTRAAGALATMPNGDLLAAGPERLIRWDGTSWQELAFVAPPGGIYSVTTRPNGDVIVGGSFPAVNGVPSANVARWNTAGWSPLAEGMDRRVRALITAPDGDLIAGGWFTRVGDAAIDRIACWNGTDWLAIGAGLDLEVFALAVGPGGDLIAGGNAGLRRWNGTSWSSIVRNDPWIEALVTMPNGDLVAGGPDLPIDTVNDGIARWDGTSWSGLGTGISSNAGQARVSALAAMPNGDLIAAGRFDRAGGVLVNSIARWDGATWSPLGSGIGNGVVFALRVMRDGSLLVGGPFGSAGGMTVNSIARWDGAAWSSLGAGVSGVVEAIWELPDGDVVVAGQFTTGGPNGATNVARWDGTAWTPFGSGTNGRVWDLHALGNGDLVLGGEFTVAGGRNSSHLARVSTSCPALGVSLGTPCVGAGGAVVLTVRELPWLGGAFVGTTTGLPAAAIAFAVTGFSQIATPLPVLFPMGTPGCLALAAPDSAELLFESGGAVRSRVAIPDQVNLIGLPFHHQVLPFELDALLAVTAVTASNALRLTVGVF